ncbi:glycosyltransferase [Thomasclavelia cocleata]|uniref:glycosyltransferase n=1 Tax=Thomasclavelia cocleata TaxID=69824 RepID=UPI0024957778|nr:glycosyltransferase [Thomasclavelia cocleata]
MKKKIMILISNLNIGGTEKALLNMLEIMDQNMYEVDVYLLEKKGGFLNELPEWINLKIIDDYQYIASWIMDAPWLVVKKLIFNYKFIIAFELAFTHLVMKLTGDRTKYYNIVLNNMKNIEKQYDVAIAYAGPMNFITIYILKKVIAKEKIQWIHFDVSKFNFNVEFAKANYKFFNKIVVVSRNAANKLLEKLPSIKDKIEIIPNFLPEKQCMEKSLEFDPYKKVKNKKIILTVGRLTSEKGQIIIPEIVRLLIDKGIDNFIWYIVGDGNQRGKVQDKILEYQVNNYIKLEGVQKNPYPYYKGADLYVQTSLHEGYCITIAEALLFSKYVISTDVAGAYDQIKNDEIGKIVKYDIKELTNTIETYFKA